MKPLQILYTGDLKVGATARSRMEALIRLGHHVHGFDYAKHHPSTRMAIAADRLNRRLRGHWSLRKLSQALGSTIQALPRIDLLWVDKGVRIGPQLIQLARECHPQLKVVGYLPDDIRNPRNESLELRAALPEYDLLLTNRTVQVDELIADGARRVLLVGKSFDPYLHRPVELRSEVRAQLGGPVGFVGAYEEERARSIDYLGYHGVPVKVWGDGWSRLRRSPNVQIAGTSQYGKRYVEIVCSFDIALGFLRKANRDQHTSRSLEIPACGTFLLAERTEVHRSLFREGVEAEYFADDEELLSKVRSYLADPSARRRIATAGRERCLSSGYSTDARLSFVLKSLEP